MPPARSWPRPRRRPRPRASCPALATARLQPSWRWRFWAGLSAWGWGGKAQEALQQRYRIGSLLGRGGFGRVFSATRLSDGAPVAIKKVPRNRIRDWGELPDGTSAPLEIVLLDKVSTGFSSVVQLLEWFELPKHIVMVLERPERCEDLRRYIRARRFLPEEEARELFRQVLEAVRHCTSCGVLHRDIKPENILVDLDTGEAKLIDFGCGTYLQDTAYTQFAGTRSYRPPEWTNFGWYHGEAATVWTLGILLHEMVCGKHPFRRGWNISWGHLLLPQQLSQVATVRTARESPAWAAPTSPLPTFPSRERRGRGGTRVGSRWDPGGERWDLGVCLATAESAAQRALIG
ncbi:serine/threonine-protein kinase pim-1-like [Poecile atricapillus]|uniref:serine/threonine-protein kinase pim-1-like n=1 Tax=Poecile atricapillus TaxID=48891 RepID=UPI002739BFB5|nr:serine/threonine-protein kinase pim-1-like [Poecile atricapillus]